LTAIFKSSLLLWRNHVKGVPLLELLTFGPKKVQVTGWSRQKNAENKGLGWKWPARDLEGFAIQIIPSTFRPAAPGNLADWPASRRVFARSVPVTSKTSEALEHLWRNLRRA
jgi:hypothetical protein